MVRNKSIRTFLSNRPWSRIPAAQLPKKMFPATTSPRAVLYVGDNHKILHLLKLSDINKSYLCIPCVLTVTVQ